MKSGSTRIFIQAAILILVLSTGAGAQQIGNVRAEQNGNKIIVFYDIIQSQGEVLFDVSLYVAVDGGEFEGPLRSVSGDAGENITGGRNRQIVWDVLEERDELKSTSVEFRVVARAYDGKTIEMVFVEGGEYIQGSDLAYDEKPPHSVRLKDFFIGKFEISQLQWKRIMGENPSNFNECAECPVENVSWRDIEKFLTELNRQTGLTYRLPTEAEWEYASRGGKNSKNYIFSGGDDADAVAWFSENNKQHTRKTGLKQANELGIFDMSGNVMEWCSDWYRNTYYMDASYENPSGPGGGTHKVIRGGSWNTPRDAVRSCNRSYTVMGARYDDLGFRLARDAK